MKYNQKYPWLFLLMHEYAFVKMFPLIKWLRSMGMNGDADSPVGTGSNGGSQIFKRMASVAEWNRNTRKRHTKEHTDLLLNKQYGATINREKAHTDMFARPNVIDRRTSVQQSTRFKSNQKWLFSFRQWSNIPWHIRPSHGKWVLYDFGGELRGLW